MLLGRKHLLLKDWVATEVTRFALNHAHLTEHYIEASNGRVAIRMPCRMTSKARSKKRISPRRQIPVFR